MSTDLPATGLVIVDFQEKLYAVMPEPRRDRAARAAETLGFCAGELGMPIAITEQYPRGLGSTLPALRVVEPVEKTSFSACGEPRFVAPAKRVVLAGMEAHICVYWTAVDLLERGHAVVVASDAVVSRREEDREVAMHALRARGAEVLPSETLMFGWLGVASGPLFKEISRRIR
jgi:nicotinamidase-related amidase